MTIAFARSEYPTNPPNPLSDLSPSGLAPKVARIFPTFARSGSLKCLP
jgi:hypothetical protein